MRKLFWLLAVPFGLAILGISALGIAAAFAWPQLPELDVLTDYRPRIPLRVLTADGYLLAEYGEERRTFARVGQLPEALKQAIVAAEDDHFYQHRGVDFAGLARATALNLAGGGRRQGGSTITMQVARNFYLSREKTLNRKLYEILLAVKIEQNLSKERILELYANQIYLGQRAYGFAAAAQAYYGKALKELSVAECAMLAGLPKAPSAYNPVVNPERARLRQQYVLRRMRELGFLDQARYEHALAAPLKLAPSARSGNVVPASLRAEYVAEMARQLAVEQFGEAAYSRGITVKTTLVRADQEAAYQALRRNVINYDRRHGYRGAEGYVELPDGDTDPDRLDELFDRYPRYDDLVAAIVLQADRKLIKAYLQGGRSVEVSGEGLRFGLPMLADDAPATKRIRRGAMIRLVSTDKGWAVAQLPEVEGAFVALNPQTGAIRALVGGFDFYRNKFNHVTQAWRQPGSSFKPFIYSAALEKGYAPSSIFEDGPLTFSAGATGSQAWTPQNYDGKFDGPMSLRTALAKSKNMVSISLLNAIGPKYAQDYITRFGFDAARHPPYLTMALGAGAVTPWQMAGAYAVFANGGYRVQPYVVQEMRDETGKLVARADPPSVGGGAERVLDERNAYLMDSMMKDVVRRGTATRARVLNRADLAGKTGTTNEYVDAWFCGYQPTLVGIAWMGFDQPRRLGSGETGGALALPIWIGYMEKALRGVPERYPAMPAGLIRVSPESKDEELIYREHLPVEVQEAPGEPEPPVPAAPAPPVEPENG